MPRGNLIPKDCGDAMIEPIPKICPHCGNIQQEDLKYYTGYMCAACKRYVQAKMINELHCSSCGLEALRVNYCCAQDQASVTFTCVQCGQYNKKEIER